jgi:hypothetical protein
MLPADAAGLTEDAFHAALAAALVAIHDPQVLFAYFRDVDAAEPLAWDRWEPRAFRGRAGLPPHRGPVRESYVAFDSALGRLVDAVGSATDVIVVSDHGHHAWFTWFGRGTPGGHTDAPDGVFLAAGPHIRPDAAPIHPSVYDVTPTVLSLVGLPAAADMRGDPLESILRDVEPRAVVATWERAGGAPGLAVPSDDDEVMLERLRALGYVR